MATIVVNIETGKRYVLVGTGYGAFRSERPGVLGGNFVPTVREGKVPVVCACDESGKLWWIKSRSIRVETVDGATPKSILDTQ